MSVSFCNVFYSLIVSTELFSKSSVSHYCCYNDFIAYFVKQIYFLIFLHTQFQNTTAINQTQQLRRYANFIIVYCFQKINNVNHFINLELSCKKYIFKCFGLKRCNLTVEKQKKLLVCRTHLSMPILNNIFNYYVFYTSVFKIVFPNQCY